ncbi:hypothetical protein BDR05DRAFT_195947 [Suillus weaverae]|nr:hypothetical protein BDR05DRAFT_195947 [Suillus weaverae]
MAARTMPSESQDLPVASLPLTQTQRDELDQAIRGTAGTTLLRKIRDSETAHTNLELALLAFAFSLTTHILNRNNLKNVLDPDMLTLATTQQHSQLRKMMRNACQTSSYSRILDLKMLQKSDASSPMWPELAQGQDEFEFLYDSFVRPYIGEAVDGFYEYLKNNHTKFKGGGRLRPYYAKFCSIVQSSGTGKSRLMTELRNKDVLVLYMNQVNQVIQASLSET